MSAPFLTVSDLTCARGGVPVLAGLSFSISPGQALILRGPNGSGKTTLLRTLVGLQPPVSGEIAMPEDCAAYASHADGVKSTLTVEENLTFWASVYGQDIPESVFTRFDLEGLRDRPAGQLSAGQGRRLGLARLAVIGRPLLFLDEPTVSLDQRSVARFADFVAEHLAAGGAVIAATHIELGMDAPDLDLTHFKAKTDRAHATSDAAFL